MHFEDLCYASLVPSTGDPAISKAKPVPSGHSTKEDKVTHLTFCCGMCLELPGSDGQALSPTLLMVLDGIGPQLGDFGPQGSAPKPCHFKVDLSASSRPTPNGPESPTGGTGFSRCLLARQQDTE